MPSLVFIRYIKRASSRILLMPDLLGCLQLTLFFPLW